MSASDTIQNNVTFSLTGVLTTTGTSVAISTDTTNGGACAFTNASILLTNQDGTIIERVRGTASAGTLTLVTRGIKQDKTLTTDSSLQKEWRPGTLGFVTVFASDTADIDGDVTVFGNLVTTDTSKPGYTPQSLTQTQINALPTTGTGLVYNSTTGLYQTLVAGSWVNVASGSTPNGSETVAGKYEEATQTETDNGASIGGTLADLVSTPAKIAASVQKSAWTYAASSDGTDTYTISLTPALSAYSTGLSVRVKFTTANTGACTLNVNGLGAKSIKLISGSDPLDGNIVAGGIYDLLYDGTNFILNPATNAATTSDITTATNTTKFVTPAQLRYKTGMNMSVSNVTVSAGGTSQTFSSSAQSVKGGVVTTIRSGGQTTGVNVNRWGLQFSPDNSSWTTMWQEDYGGGTATWETKTTPSFILNAGYYYRVFAGGIGSSTITLTVTAYLQEAA